MPIASLTTAQADPGVIGHKVQRLLDAMAGLPMIAPVGRLASEMGWPARVLCRVLDEAEALHRLQRWDDCPDGPAAIISPSEMAARGLAPGDDGRWIKESSRSYRGRRHANDPVRESELFAGGCVGGWESTAGVHSGFTGGFDILPGKGPSPLDLMIAAEDLADAPLVEDEPDRSRGGRPADLSSLKGMAGRTGSLPPLTLVGEGGIWCGPQPRQVGTEKNWVGRRVDGRGYVTARGKVEESARIAPHCPGCGGRELSVAEFCVRCSSPATGTANSSSKTRRMREEYDEHQSERAMLHLVLR
ncbi:hypothetical protein EP7_005655 (plasmid) [Isosphaeraceae bacterium EP7]